jgi:hypothetical protein
LFGGPAKASTSVKKEEKKYNKSVFGDDDDTDLVALTVATETASLNQEVDTPPPAPVAAPAAAPEPAPAASPAPSAVPIGWD